MEEDTPQDIPQKFTTRFADFAITFKRNTQARRDLKFI